MSLYKALRAILIGAVLALLLSSCGVVNMAAFSPITEDGGYQYRTIHNPDGTGKFYMGREIANVMGHEGAAWLERPSRAWEERPAQVLDALNLQPTDVVADIGAGTGYFSFQIATLVPDGQVFAVDIQPEMLDIIEFLKEENQVETVIPVLGSLTSPNLPPESVDLALMVDAYHEFDHPREMMEELVKSLKPGGRVALVEYKGENPLIPIKALHKMTQRQVKREMQAVGLVWDETYDQLPQQHLLIFRKPS